MLLIQRSGYLSRPYEWDIPGGRAEGAETPLETAKRETVEEVGRWPADAVVRSSLVTGAYVTFFVDLTRPFDARLSDEHKEFEWTSPKWAQFRKMHPMLQNILAGLTDNGERI